MCVSAGPAYLAATRIFAGEFSRDGRVLHSLIYQNEVSNEADGPNCMLLHFPSAQVMTRENAVVDDEASEVLDGLIGAVKVAPRGGGADDRCAAAEVFEYGVYTVVMSQSPAAVLEALADVPPHKRPDVKSEILSFYGEQFPGWTLALCCFDNRDRHRAQPLVWWYEPMFPETLFAPGIDSHDGSAPDLSREVACDHEVVFGTFREADRRNVSLGRLRHRHTGALAEMLPSHATYAQYGGRSTDARYPNADFVLSLDDLMTNPWPSIKRSVIAKSP